MRTIFWLEKGWLQIRNTGWLDFVTCGKSVFCAVTNDKWKVDEDLRAGVDLRFGAEL
jgi:hypothetical protein